MCSQCCQYADVRLIIPDGAIIDQVLAGTRGMLPDQRHASLSADIQDCIIRQTHLRTACLIDSSFPKGEALAPKQEVGPKMDASDLLLRPKSCYPEITQQVGRQRLTAAALQAHEYDRRTAIGGITPDLVQRSYPVGLTSCQQDPTV